MASVAPDVEVRGHRRLRHSGQIKRIACSSNSTPNISAFVASVSVDVSLVSGSTFTARLPKFDGATGEPALKTSLADLFLSVGDRVRSARRDGDQQYYVSTKTQGNEHEYRAKPMREAHESQPATGSFIGHRTCFNCDFQSVINKFMPKSERLIIPSAKRWQKGRLFPAVTAHRKSTPRTQRDNFQSWSGSPPLSAQSPLIIRPSLPQLWPRGHL